MRGDNVSQILQGYYTGTDLTKDDKHLTVKIVGHDAAKGPRFQKLATGAGATDQVGVGQVEVVESIGSKRAPNTFGGVTINAVGTRVYARKSRGNPASTDVGNFAVADVSTTGSPIAGGVISDSSATSGVGLIVDITGTGANDFLVLNTYIRTR